LADYGEFEAAYFTEIVA
jgi:hypothetical protein